ncbi:Acetyltransferase (GNAT) family protein [Thiothrix caldifontis]|uniref:Acetyltransferase (GNAT) family protein n=1 Tax=Thiothrix caldifontis TaxID=525918 RepID=A0A1H4GUC4_9GAMM|nr:GNAT family N-acetyltransferase [Thiothrix caldifontis]SEB12931.1 Acetyltransferase (GNAT) family protein [Thiothrix caldifontis]
MSQYPTASKMRVPRELEIVLNGPIGPQRLRDDTIVIEKDGWYRTLTPSATFSAANEILFCNLDKRDPDSHIDAIIAEYQNRRLPLSWCVYPWTQPADLGKRLLARGATGSNVRAYLTDTALPLKVVEGVDVEHVAPASTEGLETYISTLSAGYALPADEEAFRRSRYRQLMAEPNPVMHLFIARCDGVVTGCSAMIVKQGSAHLTSSSVLPAFQGRGVFQSLIATSLATLREMGIPFASGHSNDKSAFWVERFGFKFIYAYTIYELENSSPLG